MKVLSVILKVAETLAEVAAYIQLVGAVTGILLLKGYSLLIALLVGITPPVNLAVLVVYAFSLPKLVVPPVVTIGVLIGLAYALSRLRDRFF